MSGRHTLIRSLHDVGLAAWFGGSLMGAVGLNGAAEHEGSTVAARSRIASAGWAKWVPVNAAAIGAHLFGGGGLLAVNAHRVRTQHGVGASTAAKTVVTAAALAATAYASRPRQEGGTGLLLQPRGQREGRAGTRSTCTRRSACAAGEPAARHR